MDSDLSCLFWVLATYKEGPILSFPCFWHQGPLVTMKDTRPNAHISAPSKGFRLEARMSLHRLQSPMLSPLQTLWTDQRVTTFWVRSQKPIGVWYNGIKGDSYPTCLSEQGRQLVSKAWLALSSTSPHISHGNKPALAPQSPCLP